LLGRYSVAHLRWMFLLIPISIMALYLTWSNEENKKRRQIPITALILSIIVPILLVDLFIRLAQPKQYVMHRSYYYRAPNTVVGGTFRDVPENAFSYPTMRSGYPDIEYILTTDKRGFRNKTDLEKYDIITLGDSFVEGSNVTDDDVWVTLLAQKSKLIVYNLGMAGGHPGTYLETFKRFALDLSPKIVLCMVYEGNDFHDSNFKRKDTFGHHLNNYFKSSPVRRTLEELLIRHLGSIDSNTSEDSLASGDNPAGSDKADADTASVNAFAYRRQIKELCDAKNIRLIIVYAPDKPHVLLPLIRHKVPPESLRAFMALKENNLPPTYKLMDIVLAHVEMKESVVKKFCQQESIEFVSLTEPLRQSIAQGRQLYFTYDDHWTPIGHEVAANTIYNCIDELPTSKTN